MVRPPGPADAPRTCLAPALARGDPIIAIMTGSLSSPIVVGRATELAAIDAALQRSIEGTASVVLIGGDAGMGKTRLIQAAAHRSREAGAGC